jgi:hypothetical protein
MPVTPPDAVVTVIVVEPDPDTVAGLNEAVAPAGSPAAENETALENPLTALTVTV